MYKRDKTNDSNADQTKTTDERDAPRKAEGTTDIREANENIRKAQGEDSGHPPTIDRHR